MLNPKVIRCTNLGEYVECILEGDWVLSVDSSEALSQWQEFCQVEQTLPKLVVLKMNPESKWDSSLLIFIFSLEDQFKTQGVRIDLSNLPQKVLNLLEFAERRKAKSGDDLNLGQTDLPSWWDGSVQWINRVSTFWGKWLVALYQFLTGRSFMRLRDFMVACKSCGASALPIITLIAFLTGLTLAFVGSVQLEKFNATIYVADLVSLAMVREMGPLMVAIVMAGRTGASFAAELGSMKLREEVDSLRTFGIPAIDFLVLPRTLALFLMTPLLTMYADLVGILGGLTVGTQVMDFSSLHYYEQTETALTHMWEIYSGLIKSLAFGLIIGLVGCYKGLHTGNDSAALGRSVTSSVVVSITFIVVCDALFEIAFSFLGYR